jgi:D-amino peptidase
VRRVRDGGVPVPEIARPAFLELDLQTADMAEVATWVRGVERMGELTVGIRDDDLLALYSTFVAVTYITRKAGGR